jgi:lipopolysaccharide transport system ATP-binding protein
MRSVISVSHLSKHYRLGLIGGGTLREDLQSWWARIRGRPDPLVPVDHEGSSAGFRNSKSDIRNDEIWALRDVSFEVKQGEILGIIGRNGAGKSTLLKILSRITAPTLGRVRIKGRVGSLLEVGTGFHPELTGRENIYLNGAVLGMKKMEIDRKIDEIVDFSEVERFIDTPVKRYSSGMYVRLAFAVAAHLDSEILLVDEVLAVGDAAFQSKCLGKMETVAEGGRTLLFVSHNMQAVQSLCSRCLLLRRGRVTASAAPEPIINEYLHSTHLKVNTKWEHPVGLGNQDVCLKRLEVYAPTRERGSDGFLSSNDLHIELEVWLRRPVSGLCVGFDLLGDRGETVLRSYDTDAPLERFEPLRTGANVLRCLIPRGLLNAGRFAVAPRIGIHNQEWIVSGDPLASFTVTLTHGQSPFWNSLGLGTRPGVVAPVLSWVRC